MEKEPQELEQMMMQTITNMTRNVQRDSLNMERTLIRAAEKHIPEFSSAAVTAWTPTKERLATMTKAIRQQALEQSGFAKAYSEAKGEKAYTALLNQKTDDAVKAILDFNFDWSQFAPTYYQAAIKEQKYNF